MGMAMAMGECVRLKNDKSTFVIHCHTIVIHCITNRMLCITL